MKRAITSGLSLILCIGLCACGESQISNIPTDITNKAISNIENVLNWSCKYSNGEKITLKNLTEEGIEEATDDYNKSGVINFKTTAGETIEISGGTYKTQVDVDAEYEFLQEAIAKNEAIENREPIYKRNVSDIGDTYLEISLDNQQIYVYKDGQLISESPVVTGTNTNPNRRTPTGIYYISERINGKYLRGEGYCTWVNKWMRLTNSGVGLHDAGWRGSFGGSIYQYDGSHGCINLPTKFAYELFDIATVGMPVIIY